MNYTDQKAKCPYFRRFRQEEAEIICEGIVPGAKKTTIVFSSRDKAAKFYGIRCCAKHEECPVAMECDEKWRDLLNTMRNAR